MFYKSSKPAYKLLGAYQVQRKPMALSWDKNRKYAALSYRMKGSSHFICQGQEFSVDDGDILYIPSGVDYCHENGQEELYVIHLLCYDETETTIRQIPGTKEMAQFFRQVVHFWQTSGSYNRSMAALYELFALLEQQTQQHTAVAEVITPGVEMLQKEFCRSNLTVAELADACFISQVYFRKLYRQHFGVSPQQAITKLRFEYAANLLRSGYYTPKQAADASGFSDVKYFRTAFTKYFGCTPSAYIKKPESVQSK